tara:strand:- start:6187 stop:6885 length:699 start_codon:yes stop_codon:yes gene_type:complete
LKFVLAIFLLPFCFATGQLFWELVFKMDFSGMVLIPLIAGMICMALLYCYLPKPIWVYVLGHEFTHAIATMLCGGRVRGMKVTSDGGHVYVTRDNFFVTLSPYFIPIYAILVFALFALAQYASNLQNSHMIWGLFFWALGLSYCFHVFLTAHILRTRQPDIVSQGYLFSAVIIYLGNMIVLFVGLILVSVGLELGQVVRNLYLGTIEAYLVIGDMAQNTAISINSVLKSDSG